MAFDEDDNSKRNGSEQHDENRGALNIAGGAGHVHDERLRQRLHAFIVEHPHLTSTVLSRSDYIGCSRTMLDAYLKGVYFTSGGPGGRPIDPKNSKLERLIRDYLDREEGIFGEGNDIGIFRSVLMDQFEYACNTAIQENIVAVAYGSPGYGKSVAMQQYKLNRLTTPPIFIRCSRNVTPGYFIRRLARGLNIKKNACIPELEELVIEQLLKQKRLIFVDQANYLDERGIGSIMEVWEGAKVGVVLAGTYKLYETFMMLSDAEDIKGQMASRVALYVPLMGLSLSEVKSIVPQVIGPEATLEVVMAIWNTIARTNYEDGRARQGASFRHLAFLLPRLKALIARNRNAIDSAEVNPEDLVELAAKKLMLS